MASNVQVNIGADARQALGQIEVLKASIRDLGRETGTAARTAARTGDEALIDLNGPMIAPGETLSGPLDCCGGTIDSVCIHYGSDGWTTFKAVFLLGPILAALGFVATVKPVWIMNKNR